MAKRNSDRERVERDAYYTPPHVLDCLVRAVTLRPVLWEPASGEGACTTRLRALGFKVYATDIDHGVDFLALNRCPFPDIMAIVTNPPFNQAMAFIEHGLELMGRRRGALSLLLPTDFDHGSTRVSLFRDCPAYAGQVKLLRRIVWFLRDDGQKEHPSENHSWFHWDFRHSGEPWVRYQSWLD